MTTRQLRILKYIEKKPRSFKEIKSHFHLSDSDFLATFDDDDFYRYYDGVSRSSDFDSRIIQINNYGQSFLDIEKRSTRRFIISTSIAIISAIGAYREQLFSLIRLLLRLLK